jgi:hypothetical protein
MLLDVATPAAGVLVNVTPLPPPSLLFVAGNIMIKNIVVDADAICCATTSLFLVRWLHSLEGCFSKGDEHRHFKSIFHLEPQPGQKPYILGYAANK